VVATGGLASAGTCDCEEEERRENEVIVLFRRREKGVVAPEVDGLDP
jgi:hypothetical protein